MQTDELFPTRRARADREAFRRILNREGGETPRPEDRWPEDDAIPSDADLPAR